MYVQNPWCLQADLMFVNGRKLSFECNSNTRTTDKYEVVLQKELLLVETQNRSWKSNPLTNEQLAIPSQPQTATQEQLK
jgi:hypothetical protein